MSPKRSSSPPRKRPPARAGGRAAPPAARAAGAGANRGPVLVLAGVALVAVVLAVIALLAGGGDDDAVRTSGGDSSPAEDLGSGEPDAVDSGNDGDGNGSGGGGGLVDEDAVSVTVTGTPLPAFESGVPVADDDAIGAAFPTLTGTGLDGRPLTLAGGDGPMVVVFLAHWCPHCQAEVPVLVDIVERGELAGDVALVGVSTGMDERRDNWPPSEWLAREGWEQPTLVDPDNQAAIAAGLTSFPYFVFVDGDGEVAARASGELEPEDFDRLVGLIAGT